MGRWIKKRSCGEIIPLCYGIAYRDYAIDQDICYPIPINWFVHWARLFYFFLAIPKRNSHLEKLERDLARKWRIDYIQTQKDIETRARQIWVESHGLGFKKRNDE